MHSGLINDKGDGVVKGGSHRSEGKRVLNGLIGFAHQGCVLKSTLSALEFCIG